MPAKKFAKKDASMSNPAMDFQELLAKVQSAPSAMAVKEELSSFQSRMQAKTTPGQTAKALAIRNQMLAGRAAQGKSKVPMTETERQAFMKDILTGMGIPPSVIQKKKGKQ